MESTPLLYMPFLELAPSSRFGRSLRTTAAIARDEVVLRDTPLLAWHMGQATVTTCSICVQFDPRASACDANTVSSSTSPSVCDVWKSFAQHSCDRRRPGVAEVDGETEGATTSHPGDDEFDLVQLNRVLEDSSNYSFADVPIFMRAAALAYVCPSLSDANRQVIQAMHVPDLPLKDSLLPLIQFCSDLSNVVQSSSTAAASSVDTLPTSTFLQTPKSVLHAVMAAMVNAHRGPNGEWVLYPWASKLAHSCNPSLMYLPKQRKFVALRAIAKGEFVTFSYLGGPMLVQSSERRQTRLLDSHLFLCACDRCVGLNVTRCLPCAIASDEGTTVLQGELKVGTQSTEPLERITDRAADTSSNSTEVVVVGCRAASSLRMSDADFVSQQQPSWVAAGRTTTAHSSIVVVAPPSEEVLTVEGEVVERVLALTGPVGPSLRLNDLTKLASLLHKDLTVLHWAYPMTLWQLGSYFLSLLRTVCVAMAASNGDAETDKKEEEEDQEDHHTAVEEDNDTFLIAQCSADCFLLYYRWVTSQRVGDGASALLRAATSFQLAKVFYYYCASTEPRGRPTASRVEALFSSACIGFRLSLWGDVWSCFTPSRATAFVDAAVIESGAVEEMTKVVQFMRAAAKRTDASCLGGSCESPAYDGRHEEDEEGLWTKEFHTLVMRPVKQWQRRVLLRKFASAILARSEGE